jgi:hypothetical protein
LSTNRYDSLNPAIFEPFYLARRKQNTYNEPLAYGSEKLLFSGCLAVFSTPHVALTALEHPQIVKKVTFTGCSKITGCKAHAIVRNEAYFSVRRRSAPQQTGFFQQPA